MGKRTCRSSTRTPQYLTPPAPIKKAVATQVCKPKLWEVGQEDGWDWDKLADSLAPGSMRDPILKELRWKRVIEQGTQHAPLTCSCTQTDRQTLKFNTLNTPSIHPYQRLISDPPQIQMEDSIRTDWCQGGKHRTLPSLNFWVFPYILQTQHQGRSPLANRHPRLGAIHSCWTNPPLFWRAHSKHH